MKPLRKRILKRKLKRFWNEWGLSKQDAIDLLGAGLVVVGIPFILSILGALLYKRKGPVKGSFFSIPIY